MDISRLQGELRYVISLAEKAFQIQEEISSTEFLDALDLYLYELEKWQETYREYLGEISEEKVHIEENERIELRSNLDKIKEIHHALIGRAQTLMSDVNSELSQVNKKAIGIKKYVDILPHRISVNPVKKG